MLCAVTDVSEERIELVERVLVTGGAGFIGSHLVDRLVREGFDVVVLDDLSSGRRDNLSVHFGKPNFCLVEGNVRVKADVKRALEDVDVVFHLAAIVSVHFSVKNPLLVNEVNVDGTLNVLRESLKAGVKRFVFASSCAVYGKPVNLPVNEDQPTKPMSPYGVTKLALSIISEFFMRFMGLRLFARGFLMFMGLSKVWVPILVLFLNLSNS
jgi:nucleoside-diphosphate-sugar epimerase